MEYKTLIPVGESGAWTVRQFELTEKDLQHDFLQSLRDMRNLGEDRRAKPGKYTELRRNGAIIMSDTPAEIRDLRSLEFRASGDVLIHGLGLGVAVELVLAKRDVKSVTVIEKSQDVIRLVAETLLKRWGDRLKIIEADAYEWKPRGAKFDCVWSDIWDNICTDNLPQMDKLRRKWAKSTNWHGFWCKAQCQRARR